jgi:hypothetical protein
VADIWVWEIELARDHPRDVIERADLTGFAVEASDGHIGTVDEATNDAGRGILVVDTGFWIFGKKRMIPAGLVNAIDTEARTVSLAVTKEHVKQAPDFDEVRREEAAYRDEVAHHYDRFRGDTIGPVAGTGRAPGELTGDPIGPVAGTGTTA